MSSVNTYRELEVWQKSMKFVTDIYKLTQNFPNNEQFRLTSQFRRSAVSIPSNIAEGFGRRLPKKFIRFLRISISSLFELQTQLEISKNIELIDLNIFDHFYENSRENERMLKGLISSIKY
ncbi:MAG: four helix bundle protein [Candidatus Marinimicrobia bacterium]|nr:four helix bundle protein [Candidatus Neomarinimicrobiota bacterium]